MGGVEKLSNGNGNSEVQKLVALKHGYKDEVSQLEADLKTKFEQELAVAKKDLKDKYLEKLVDWFYSNGFNAPTPQPVVVPEPVEAPPAPTPSQEEESEEVPPTVEELPEPEPVLSTPVCADCGTELQPDAKFCTQCAAPVETAANTPSGPVAPASGMTYPQRPFTARPQPQPVKQEYQAAADRRFSEWSRTKRR